MEYKAETPFDNIESAQEYLGLLVQAVEEARENVEADIQEATNAQQLRRLDALRLVLFKLDKLVQHVKGGRRLLNDLRMLRRLMLEERVAAPVPQADSEPKVR